MPTKAWFEFNKPDSFFFFNIRLVFYGSANELKVGVVLVHF